MEMEAEDCRLVKNEEDYEDAKHLFIHCRITNQITSFWICLKLNGASQKIIKMCYFVGIEEELKRWQKVVE